MILMEKNVVFLLFIIMIVALYVIITGIKWMLSVVDIVLMNIKELRNNIWVKYILFKENI